MTIDEAIKHAREVAEDNRNNLKYAPFTQEKCIKCAEEHEQLAEWLEELKELRKMREDIESNAECLVQQGRKDAIDEFWTEFDRQIKSNGKQTYFFTEFLRIGMNLKE